MPFSLILLILLLFSLILIIFIIIFIISHYARLRHYFAIIAMISLFLQEDFRC